MKKIFIMSLLAASSALTTFGQAAEESKTLAVKANILPYLIDNNNNESYFLFSTAIRINVEKQLSSNKSLVFELGFAGPLTFDIENGEAGEHIATTGIISGFGNKFYLNHTAPNGIYLLPMLNFSKIKLLEHAEGAARIGYVGFQDLGISGVLGCQAIGSRHWVIDLYAGAHIFSRNYFDSTFLESAEVINHNEIGIKPVLGVSIGKIF